MRYVAFLRGIMPMNPNMKGDKLKGLFESLGFKNVSTVIASGNVVFDSPSKSVEALEAKIERELPKQLGFKSTTIIRSQDDIAKLVASNPFKGIKDEKPNYLVVTFFKDRKAEVCSVIDLDSREATDFMRSIEKSHGKEITTRTWKTVLRVQKRMQA